MPSWVIENSVSHLATSRILFYPTGAVFHSRVTQESPAATLDLAPVDNRITCNLGQYHGSWCPGSWCCQVISSHVTDNIRLVGSLAVFDKYEILTTYIFIVFSNSACKGLSHLVLRLEYSGRSRSISWLSMPCLCWCLASLHCQIISSHGIDCKISRYISCIWKHYNCQCYFSVKEWQNNGLVK